MALQIDLHANLRHWHLLEEGNPMPEEKIRHRTSSRQEHRDTKYSSRSSDGAHQPTGSMGSCSYRDGIPLSGLNGPQLLGERLHLDIHFVGIEVSARYVVSLNSCRP